MFNISSQHPIYISAILLIASFLLSFFIYKNNSLKPLKKYILIFLKTLALFLLLVLFLEPSLLSFFTEKKSLSIVLIDNSRSIKLILQDETANTNYKMKLKSLQSVGNLEFITFGSSSNSIEKPEYDSLQFNDYSSDFNEALGNIRLRYPENNFNSVTVISDGQLKNKAGVISIARQLGIPFIVVAVGDTVQHKDILIENILYDKKAFTSVPLKITVKIKAFGFEGSNVSVELLREDKPFKTLSEKIESDGFSKDITFEITENNEEKLKYTVLIKHFNGEITDKNNKESFYIEYINNKFKLLLINDGPGYDEAFIINISKRLKNYATTLRSLKTSNDFYEGLIDEKIISEHDIVLLHGFPSLVTSMELSNRILSVILNHKLPLVYISGKNSDYKKLSVINDLLPADYIPGTETNCSPQIIESSNNPFVNSHSFPLLKTNVSALQKPGSEVYLVNKNTGEPLVSRFSKADIHYTSFTGYNFWKWKLNPTSNNEKAAEQLILQLLDMTVEKDKKKKLDIFPEYDVFDYSQSIKIKAKVFDDNRKFIPGVNVKIKIIDEKGNPITSGECKQSDNEYYFESSPVPTGNYRIEGEALIRSELYASDENRFSADTTGGEFQKTISDFNFLKELAGNTNGTFINTNESETFKDIYKKSIDTNIHDEKQQFSINKLWENKLYLLIIIGLLTLEWVIKKRNNIL